MSNAKQLPDSYAKDLSSNNYKLLNLNEQAVAELKADLDAIYNMVDLKQATGHTLDLYGEMVGQKRGLLNDMQYRFLILTRIGINFVQGNYDTIIASVQQIFGCEASDVILKDSEKPCRVDIATFPVAVLVHAGFSSRQAVEMIETLLPIGVTVDNTNFVGSFEFAELDGIYNENEGFANMEQTIGGHFGLLLGDDDTIPILPL